MQANIYTSTPIGVDSLPEMEDVTRADIELHGVDHSDASFEGRVFVNNPQANENTEKTPQNGYVGSFYVFGHGGCFGEAGHCEVRAEQRAYDPRPSHVLTPIKATVTATEALRRAAELGEEVTVSVVPVITGLTDQTDTENVLKFDRLSIVTYKSEEAVAHTS